jgi:3-phenylpropionate/trans-cinnamate dioxygenase ferredoxin subunit
MSFVRFAPLADVPPGGHKSLRIGLRRIVVFNVSGTLYAIEDACAHMKVALSGGRLKGTRLTCSAHGWVYDIATGRRVDKSQGCVRTFALKVEGGEIMIDPSVDDPFGGDAPSGGPECEEGEDEFTPLA